MTEPQAYVPYQAYKSKRHSRNLSTLPSQVLSVAVASSPHSRRSSSASIASTTNDQFVSNVGGSDHNSVNGVSNDMADKQRLVLPSQYTDSVGSRSASAEIIPPVSEVSAEMSSASSMNGVGLSNGHNPQDSPAESPSPSVVESKSAPTARRTSTFRRVPLRDSRSLQSSSPLRSSQTLPPDTSPRSHLRQLASEPIVPSPLGTQNNSQSISHNGIVKARPQVEPIRSSSPPLPRLPPMISSPVPSVSAPSPPQSRPASTVSASLPSTRFYLPGFQPKGLYRPRTEEFMDTRKLKHDNGKIDRTRLERRLEKLINLHFSETPEKPAQLPPVRERRASSFFDVDFSDLAKLNASELWKGVLQSQNPGGKSDIRAAEQRITPWQEDASVSQCPLCSASFHPITNRKHHCRLCGRIICSLPVKIPQRAVTCSILFVADSKTGKIEEVGEGVDYGVRRRTSSQRQSQVTTTNVKQPQLGDDEKFLKGVRICRDCRLVLLRQQYIQDAGSVPFFSKLYELFIDIEKEIEDALPKFQELLMSLKNDEQPTAEASAARKRLLEAFAQYDALAKRIRTLHCPNGPGSSQDRVQMAILTRANLFLQKNMFPLQSLPKPAKRSTSKSSATSQLPASDATIDPDSEVAHALQPLLEQEALLETFVQEAKARRKFEDAQTLKANLEEVRAEIDRILSNVGRGSKLDSKGKKQLAPSQ